MWQSVYLDQHNEFVWDRFPFAYHPDESGTTWRSLKLKAGDLVEVYNDNGSTQAMVWPTPSARRNETFMLFAYPPVALSATSSARA